MDVPADTIMLHAGDHYDSFRDVLSDKTALIDPKTQQRTPNTFS